MKDILEFSTNWNQKLNCDAFTTIRIWHREIGKHVHVVPNKSTGIEPFDAVVVVCKQFSIGALTDGMSYIDTGYCADETRKIMQTMYSKKHKNWETMPYYLIILKKVKK